MPRIEDSIFQEEIASSLLSPVEQEQEQAQPEAETSEYSVAGADLLNEAIAEQGEDRFSLGDEETDRLRSERGEPASAQPEREQPTLSLEERISRQEEARQEQEQPQEKPQTAELSPEQYRQSLEQADALIKEVGLNEDPVKIATDLAPFLGNGVYQHAPLLASLDSRSTLGARDALLIAYQSGQIDPMGDLDFSKLPQVGPQAAIDASRMFTKICGIDAQLHPAKNPMLVGLALHNGKASLLHTANRKNSTDPEDVNDPEMCVRFCEALEEGQNGFVQPRTAEQDAVYRERAVRFVNALTPYALEGSRKISAGLQARQAQGSRSNSGRGRGQRIPAQFREGIRGAKAPRFQSNQDIFEPSVVAAATTQRL